MKSFRLLAFSTITLFLATNCSNSKPEPDPDPPIERSYSIQFNTMGGSPIKFVTVKENEKLIKPEDPTKNGYIFLNWYIDERYSMEYDFDLPVRKDFTLYAKWSDAIEYKIEYDLDGGTNDSRNPFKYTVETSTITFQNAWKNYYYFDGWFTDDKFQNKITSISRGTTGNFHLYAKFTPISYSISYELNGGTADPTNPTAYTVEDTVSIKNPTSIPTGYKSFSGWHLRSDLKDNTINGWEPFEYNGNKILYAEYSPIDYSITYNLDGGSNDPKNPSNYTIEDEIVLNPATKDKFTFNGWYDTNNVQVTKISKGSIGNITLTAKWIKTPDNYSWEEIKAISESGKAGEIFKIGDTKKLQMPYQDLNKNGVIDNGEVYQTVRIIGFNEDYTDLPLDGGTPDPNKAIGITFEFADLLSDANGYSLACYWNDYKDPDTGDHSWNFYPNSTIRACLVKEGAASINWFKFVKGLPEDDWPNRLYTKDENYVGKSVLDMLPNDLVKVLSTPSKYISTYDYGPYPAPQQYDEGIVNEKLFLLSPAEMGRTGHQYEEPHTTTYSYYNGAGNNRRIKHQIKGEDGARKVPLEGKGTSLDGTYPGTKCCYSGWDEKGDDYGCCYWLRSPNTDFSSSEVYWKTSWSIEDDGLPRAGYDEYKSILYLSVVYTSAKPIAPAFCI